jgi:hypothetical protein
LINPGRRYFSAFGHQTCAFASYVIGLTLCSKRFAELLVIPFTGKLMLERTEIAVKTITSSEVPTGNS